MENSVNKIGNCLDEQLAEHHLQRLSESPTFARSHAQLRLLRFLLQNPGTDDAPLKETYIGVAFYGRAADYDPREDSIVRVSVNRLRTRLAEHYLRNGADGTIHFVLPRGVYDVRVVAMAPPPTVAPPPASAGQVPQAAAAGVHRSPLLRRIGAVAGATLLVAATLVGSWKLLEYARRPWFLSGELRSNPVTPAIEAEFDPAISADSRTLAYISRRPGSIHYQIFIRPMAATGQAPRIVDTGSGDALHPAWSPNGKTIAFLHCGLRSCEFQTVSLRDGAVKTLHDLPRFSLVSDALFYEYRQMSPVWTPDGKSVIFPYRGVDDDAERLVVHNVATGHEDRLTGGDLYEEDNDPAVAPDGHTVAFRRTKMSYSELWTVDLVTHQQKRFESFGLYWVGLTWARNGSGLLTSKREPDNSWNLWWLPLDGPPQRLPVAQHMPLMPVLSPDNASLLFVTGEFTASLTLVNTVPFGTVPALNTTASAGDIVVEFSPDEKYAAILSSGNARGREIWLADVVENTLVNRRQLTHGLGDAASSIAWSPDSTNIAVGFPTERGVLKVVDIERATVETVRVPGLEKALMFDPIFSPDGKFLFASISSDDISGVYRIGTGPIPRVDLVLVHRPYDLAFDGPDSLYLDVRNTNGIEKVDLREWDPKTGPLARSSSVVVPQLRDVFALKSWTIRSGSLYYLDQHDDERRLRQLNLSTGATSAVTGTLPRVSFFNGALAYAPGRHLLIYSQLKSESGAQIMALTK